MAYLQVLAPEASQADVGSKAFSLSRLLTAGFQVPPAFVLSTQFFERWFAALKPHHAWTQIRQAPESEFSRPSEGLQTAAKELLFDAEQRRTLVALREQLEQKAWPSLAVRSSSPEEDLSGASFAGAYTSLLGVPLGQLEVAIRDCFAASLSSRVFAYKRRLGLDVQSPQMAVIVQQQIDADVAGVAFSINPLTNDYDEAVIDANWGLGESVVGGLATPDHFVVDKVTQRILTRHLGAKQARTALSEHGGTRVESQQEGRSCCLNDNQIRELTLALGKIEELWNQPVDLEWCFGGNTLHFLQVRPITRYVPLPAEMLTRPGARRQLYADISLSTGLTTNEAISPLGLDWMRRNVARMRDMFLGGESLNLSAADSLWMFAGGRMYQNLSNVLWFVSPRTLAKGSEEADALMASTIATLDPDIYRALRRPPWIQFGLAWSLLRIIWRLRRGLSFMFGAFVSPSRAFGKYQRKVVSFEKFMERLDFDLPLHTFCNRHIAICMDYLMDVEMPALAAGLAGRRLVRWAVGTRSAGVESDQLVDQLCVGFPDNVVAEMARQMYVLAEQLTPSDVEDLELLATRIDRRELSSEFLGGWAGFLARFGARGPGEMDLACPRYGDDSQLALRQLSQMVGTGSEADPHAAQQRQVKQRQLAFETLCERLGWFRRRLLRSGYRVMEQFAGVRDNPKHRNLLLFQAVRRKVCEEAHRLVQAGRLDCEEHVFDVTLDNLIAGIADKSLDLRALRRQQREFLDLIETYVDNFPAVIDSRGRILRPAVQCDGADRFRGMPVSSGVARGPAKVLRRPFEKPVQLGDVLVAYTTDPGWTPLFVNAAAVVLEVGGVLQHGAVVAREFGKPCVAGIDRLTEKIRDGQILEVDGTRGVVRICQED